MGNRVGPVRNMATLLLTTGYSKADASRGKHDNEVHNNKTTYWTYSTKKKCTIANQTKTARGEGRPPHCKMHDSGELQCRLGRGWASKQHAPCPTSLPPLSPTCLTDGTASITPFPPHSLFSSPLYTTNATSPHHDQPSPPFAPCSKADTAIGLALTLHATPSLARGYGHLPLRVSVRQISLPYLVTIDIISITPKGYLFLF